MTARRPDSIAAAVPRTRGRSASLLLAACLAAGWSGALDAEEPARQSGPQLVVASWNLEWFYDEHQGDNYSSLAKQQSAPSREHWNWKRDVAASAIAKMRPDILALQEVENQRVLYYLAQRLRSAHELNYRIAFVGGHDYYTEQDVAILYREGDLVDLVQVGRWEPTARQRDDRKLSNVTKHMFARFLVGPPPAQGAAEDGGRASRTMLMIVNLHLRARPEQAARRASQARQLNAWLQATPPRQHLLITGDFNTEHQSPQPPGATEIGVMLSRGTREPADDLLDLHRKAPAGDRATHLSGGQFDRMLADAGLVGDTPGKRDLMLQRVRVAKEACVRGREADAAHWEQTPYWSIPDAERDVSDHYPLVATFGFQ